MNQWWLARDEAVYGPYPIEQLQEMLSLGELIRSDQFCFVGTECWVTYAIFVREQCSVPEPAPAPAPEVSAPKKKRARSKEPRPPENASTAQKEYMRALGVPVTPGMTMAEARTAISAAVDGGARERLNSDYRGERRLNCAMTSINGGGSHDRGYGHPLRYVKKELVQQVIEWLDRHHPNWDAGAWGFEFDPFAVFDQWLAPAIARLHPDLIKETYRENFGPGRQWRVLGHELSRL